MMSDDDTSNESDARIAQREAQVADEPAQPRRRSSSRVRQVPNASGIPDAFAEGADVRELRRGKRPERPDLSGHERVAVANLEDDPEAGA
jgi:hypothetical protein